MEQELIQKILLKVKEGKKYRSISDDIVLDEIESYLRSNPGISKPSKLVIKEIRRRLHRIYASYQTKKKKKIDLILEELKNAIQNKKTITDITKDLLSIAVSTKERLNDYILLYKQIFNLTGQPDFIIDLGCGLNPLSFPFMDRKFLNYFAYDINEEDIKFLNKYFEIVKPLGINGKAEILDVKNLKKIEILPNSDIVFMFKLIDLINTKNKKTAEELIKTLNPKTKYIVASFSTKTLSGRPMNLPKRKGFELMLNRLNLKFETIKISNEIFYVIKSLNS